MRRLAIALAAFPALCASAADTKPALPSWFPAPEGYSVHDLQHSDYDRYRGLVLDKRNKLPRDSGDYTPVAGKVWQFRIVFPGDGDPPKAKCLQAFASILPKLEALGFHKAGDPCCGGTVLQKGPDETGTYVNNASCVVAIVEAGPAPYHLASKPPAAKREAFSAKEDIPFLPPIPGSKRGSGRNDVKEPIFIHPHCDLNVPTEAFGTRYSEREYDAPPGVSAYAVQESYKAALREAGWDDVCQLSGIGDIDAHYTRNGRDVWALVRSHGLAPDNRPYKLLMSDAGSALRTDLLKGCKAALYGVNFDFDKATLRPDSQPALNQVLALMKDDPKLMLEIGGHTDNVGKPDYNLKLSGERAAAVVQWLVAHGVAPSRLSSQGYGDTQPLVKNTSDENRAKNRRVELKRKDCH